MLRSLASSAMMVVSDAFHHAAIFFDCLAFDLLPETDDAEALNQMRDLIDADARRSAQIQAETQAMSCDARALPETVSE